MNVTQLPNPSIVEQLFGIMQRYPFATLSVLVLAFILFRGAGPKKD